MRELGPVDLGLSVCFCTFFLTETSLFVVCLVFVHIFSCEFGRRMPGKSRL